MHNTLHHRVKYFSRNTPHTLNIDGDVRYGEEENGYTMGTSRSNRRGKHDGEQ